MSERWVLVPAEPTAEMVAHGEREFRAGDGACCIEPAEECYLSMVARRPPVSRDWLEAAVERASLTVYNRRRIERHMRPVDYIGANNTPEVNHIRTETRAAILAALELEDTP